MALNMRYLGLYLSCEPEGQANTPPTSAPAWAEQAYGQDCEPCWAHLSVMWPGEQMLSVDVWVDQYSGTI